jgi:hypothetical protein
MVDTGGQIVEQKESVKENVNNVNSNIGGNEEKGGQENILENGILQVSDYSPFGKGLGKKPIDFEKLSEIYDKDNNVINLIPGAGLCIYFYLFIYLFIYLFR